MLLALIDVRHTGEQVLRAVAGHVQALLFFRDAGDRVECRTELRGRDRPVGTQRLVDLPADRVAEHGGAGQSVDGLELQDARTQDVVDLVEAIKAGEVFHAQLLTVGGQQLIVERCRTDDAIHILVVGDELERLERIGRVGEVRSDTTEAVDGEEAGAVARLQLDEARCLGEDVARAGVRIIAVVRQAAIGLAARVGQIEARRQAARDVLVDVDARVVAGGVGVVCRAGVVLARDRRQIARLVVTAGDLQVRLVGRRIVAEELAREVVARDNAAVGADRCGQHFARNRGVGRCRSGRQCIGGIAEAPLAHVTQQ